MRIGIFGCSILLALVAAGTASGQDSPTAAAAAAAPGPSYGLAPGKLEVEIEGGAYMIDHGQYVKDAGGTVVYSPGGQALAAVKTAVGISRHVALELGAGYAGYQNNLYWRPEEPHNPYLARGHLLTFRGGFRYEFRNPRARTRPYLGAGAVSTRFVGVHPSERQLCLNDGCLTIVPELFNGTKVTGYFDMGINFMWRSRWGFRAGTAGHLLKGDGPETDAGMLTPGTPTSGTRFWHAQLYFGVMRRWH
jgi:hypothetical protein